MISSAQSLTIDKASSGAFRLVSRSVVPKPLDQVFEFFSKAENLETITPPFLGFRIITELPVEMKVGALIDYRISLRGIPLKWRSKITAWEPQRRFVDEQVKGPYRSWHHEHTFEANGDETIMHDIVHYRVWLGSIVHPLLVRKDLLTIFDYRRTKIAELFGS